MLLLLQNAIERLRKAGVESAEYDARLLLAHACSVSLSELNKALIMGDYKSFDVEYKNRYEEFIIRRASREPLQYIVGYASFRYLDLNVASGVFIPRPETEIVVEEGLNWLRKSCIKNPIVVDLCAGSGAIGLSVITEFPHARVWAVEKSSEAFKYLCKNVEHTSKIYKNIDILSNYHAILADATKNDIPELLDIKGKVDLVITNPPYIPQNQIPEQIEVRDYDPEMALYGGSLDGLRIPEQIMRVSYELVKKNGVVVMEHDISQGKSLKEYAMSIGFSYADVRNDLTGRPRYLFALKNVK